VGVVNNADVVRCNMLAIGRPARLRAATDGRAQRHYFASFVISLANHVQERCPRSFVVHGRTRSFLNRSKLYRWHRERPAIDDKHARF
jgi:hypothetical protein